MADNRFDTAPVGIDVSRSRFQLQDRNLTTFNSGDLVPFCVQEVLPGDTFSVSYNSLVRMLTPVVPVMDNAHMHVAYYFVPNRLCTAHEHDWENICGIDEPTAWSSSNGNSLSSTGNTFSFSKNLSAYSVAPGSVANYMGLPIEVDKDGKEISHSPGGMTVNAMPFRAYVRIWNEWYRDENLMDSIDLETLSATDVCGSDSCLKVSKYHDYFTSCLPSPQKGPAVTLSLGDSANVNLNSSASDYYHLYVNTGTSTGTYTSVANGYSFIPAFVNTSGASVSGPVSANGIVSSSSTLDDPLNYKLKSNSYSGIRSSDVADSLTVDLSDATAMTVNELRLSFAYQRFEEKLARGGSRYLEVLNNLFGVSPTTDVVQMSQLLGEDDFLINTTQVLQTSSTDETSPLGSTGAYSCTPKGDKLFTQSFTEYGYLIGVLCVRVEQSYCQGVEKKWNRDVFTDFYQPTFANIGEQPVYTKELDAGVASGANQDTWTDSTVFGYNEAWAEYRYAPHHVTGHMNPVSGDNTLACWSYVNKFDSTPTLNENFIVQSPTNIANTLVDTTSETQFLCDILTNIDATRPMPLYSVPGMLDHH